MDFSVLGDHRIKFEENEKEDKYLDLTRESKKKVEHESGIYTNFDWCFWYSHQRITKECGRLGNNRMSGDPP